MDPTYRGKAELTKTGEVVGTFRYVARFLIITQGADETQPDRRQLHVVLNWIEELKRLVPVP